MTRRVRSSGRRRSGREGCSSFGRQPRSGGRRLSGDSSIRVSLSRSHVGGEFATQPGFDSCKHHVIFAFPSRVLEHLIDMRGPLPFVNFERFTNDRLRNDSRSGQTSGVSPAPPEAFLWINDCPSRIDTDGRPARRTANTQRMTCQSHSRVEMVPIRESHNC